MVKSVLYAGFCRLQWLPCEHELEQLILPKANEAEAAVVEGIRRVPVSTLSEVVQYLKGDLQITPFDYAMIQQKSFHSNSILKRIFRM